VSKNVYTYGERNGEIVTITCDDKIASLCLVEFANGVAECPDDTLPVDLRKAGEYAILAKTGISTTGKTAITGDIAVSPIGETAMTGFDLNLKNPSTSVYIIGSAYAANYAVPIPARLTRAVKDMEEAFTDAASRPPATGPRLNLNGGLLDGVTIYPGIYTFGSDLSLGGHIYFKGTGEGQGQGETDVFIIQISGNLVQAANKMVILMNGALAKNIFWQVSGRVEVGAGAHLEGTLLVKTHVLFITGSSLNGRVLTMTACNLQSAVIYSKMM
jgi:hypothetical protein